MPKYPDTKDINRQIHQPEVTVMISKAKTPRDKFLIAFLYLTGARMSEVCNRLQAKDFTLNVLDECVGIRLFIAKQGRIKSFHITHRNLEISKEAPFMKDIVAYVQAHAPEAILVPISTRWAQKILDECSEKTVCSNMFRHNRITQLSAVTNDVNVLKNWKGAADLRSVTPYLQIRKVGRGVKIV